MSKEQISLSVLLGANIMERRKEKRMTQVEFSDYLGIEQHSLSRMEKGLIAPKLSRLQHIADGLDCTVADLFKGTGMVAHTDTTTKARAIAEMLDDISPELQAIVFDLIKNTIHTLRKTKKVTE